jgi:hypothetical protein
VFAMFNRGDATVVDHFGWDVGCPHQVC